MMIINNCIFEAHIHHAVKTAQRMSGWILHTFRTRESEQVLPLQKSLVVSGMENVYQLRSPHKELEQVQRLFPWRPVRNSRNYWERLK